MRMLALFLGLAVVSLVAWKAVTGGRAPVGQEPSAPKQTLENVRAAARNAEAQEEQKVKEALEKATPKE